jgi:hypothetical protein
MTADQYLISILNRERVDTGVNSPVRGVQQILWPVIQTWGNQYLRSVAPSGSFAKGTANLSGTDIDLFISLSPETTESLKVIHSTLVNALQQAGYVTRLQNVSVSVTVGGYRVDLVPGKLQNYLSLDHSIYRRKADTWTKTNVNNHITTVIGGGRQNETRILKLWRNHKGLEFPSFYLELVVIAALRQNPPAGFAERVWRVFEYLRDTFTGARFVDPANTNNVISDDLTVAEKTTIRSAAIQALAATDWNQIVI